MSVDEHAPFRRGGGQVPVRYVVAPTEEPTPEPESPERSGLHRRIAVVTALALIASLVAAGQWFLGVEAEPHGPPLVAGLDEPPPVAPHQAVGAFLEAGNVDVSADVSLGTRAVTVRAAERSTGRLIWEQQVDPTHSVASLSLVEHRARGEVVVVMRRPWTTTEWRRTPGGPVFGEAEAPETSTVASLDLVTGERRRSAEWPPEAVAVSSSRGHLFRFDRAASVLSAMDDVETVSWDAPVEVGPTIAHIELREHAGWLLVMPSPGDRRLRFRGSDVFLVALDPATGDPAPWLDDTQGRYQRMVLGDAFVEATVGGGERVVRARRWSDGERLWQRFEEDVTVAAVGDRLYFTRPHERGTRLSLHDVDEGRPSWQLVLDGTPGLLVPVGEELFVTVREGYLLVVIDRATGGVARSLSYAPPHDVDEVQFDDAATPFFGADKYFVQQGEYDGVRILARALDDGRTLWEESFPGFQEVSQEGGRLVLAHLDPGGDPDGRRVGPM